MRRIAGWRQREKMNLRQKINLDMKRLFYLMDGLALARPHRVAHHCGAGDEADALFTIRHPRNALEHARERDVPDPGRSLLFHPF